MNDRLRVVATASFPHTGFEALDQESARAIRGTFRMLSSMCAKLPYGDAERALLLITTCRNEKCTLNAMYVEARKWTGETGRYVSYMDGIDKMRHGVAQPEDIMEALRTAANRFEVADGRLAEFEKKRKIYYVDFDDILQVLKTYANTIPYDAARLDFLEAFCTPGVSPRRGVSDYTLLPPSEASVDIRLERLLNWYTVARPLTKLTRAFLANIMQPSSEFSSRISEYLADTLQGLSIMQAWGYPAQNCPIEECLERSGPVEMMELSSDLARRIISFCDWAEEAYGVATKFLNEMLRGNESLLVEFPLHTRNAVPTILVAGRTFEIRADMSVLVVDMRDSTSEPRDVQRLKVEVDDVVENLKTDFGVRSVVEYDDSRVLATDSVQNMLDCAVRLWHALEPSITNGGFGGLRMGANKGEMWFGFFGDLSDLRTHAALDGPHNTIATAARLMGLDKVRFGNDVDGNDLRQSLGSYADSRALLFFDDYVRSQLAIDAQVLCQNVGDFSFKGVGSHQCWALPIDELCRCRRQSASN